MRLWPGRAPHAVVDPPGDDLLAVEALLRRRVEDLMEVRTRQIRGGAVLYRGRLTVPRDAALPALRSRFAEVGYLPYVRADGDEIVVQAWPATDTAQPPRRLLAGVLFALTCLTTLVAGAAMRTGYLEISVAWLLAGTPFAATLLAILGVHEFGHYLTARRRGAAVSLPYFIPAPPPFLFGTLGAVIRMRSAVRDRNALFDIAAAGPLAGLVLAVPAMVIGLAWSKVAPVPAGASLQIGDSVMTWALMRVVLGRVPEGFDVFLHPVAAAGWVGLFVTALNLFPAGQLDGGRIAYALLGRRHRALGYAVVTATAALGVATWSLNWFVWGALIAFFIGFRHPSPIDDLTALTPGRRAAAVACLLLFLLLLPPVPLRIVD